MYGRLEKKRKCPLKVCLETLLFFTSPTATFTRLFFTQKKSESEEYASQGFRRFGISKKGFADSGKCAE